MGKKPASRNLPPVVDEEEEQVRDAETETEAEAEAEAEAGQNKDKVTQVAAMEEDGSRSHANLQTELHAGSSHPLRSSSSPIHPILNNSAAPQGGIVLGLPRISKEMKKQKSGAFVLKRKRNPTSTKEEGQPTKLQKGKSTRSEPATTVKVDRKPGKLQKPESSGSKLPIPSASFILEWIDGEKLLMDEEKKLLKKKLRVLPKAEVDKFEMEFRRFRQLEIRLFSAKTEVVNNLVRSLLDV